MEYVFKNSRIITLLFIVVSSVSLSSLTFAAEDESWSAFAIRHADSALKGVGSAFEVVLKKHAPIAETVSVSTFDKAVNSFVSAAGCSTIPELPEMPQVQPEPFIGLFPEPSVASSQKPDINNGSSINGSPTIENKSTDTGKSWHDKAWRATKSWIGLGDKPVQDIGDYYDNNFETTPVMSTEKTTPSGQETIEKQVNNSVMSSVLQRESEPGVWEKIWHGIGRGAQSRLERYSKPQKTLSVDDASAGPSPKLPNNSVGSVVPPKSSKQDAAGSLPSGDGATSSSSVNSQGVGRADEQQLSNPNSAVPSPELPSNNTGSVVQPKSSEQDTAGSLPSGDGATLSSSVNSQGAGRADEQQLSNPSSAVPSPELPSNNAGSVVQPKSSDKGVTESLPTIVDMNSKNLVNSQTAGDQRSQELPKETASTSKKSGQPKNWKNGWGLFSSLSAEKPAIDSHESKQNSQALPPKDPISEDATMQPVSGAAESLPANKEIEPAGFVPPVVDVGTNNTVKPQSTGITADQQPSTDSSHQETTGALPKNNDAKQSKHIPSCPKWYNADTRYWMWKWGGSMPNPSDMTSVEQVAKWQGHPDFVLFKKEIVDIDEEAEYYETHYEGMPIDSSVSTQDSSGASVSANSNAEISESGDQLQHDVQNSQASDNDTQSGQSVSDSDGKLTVVDAAPINQPVVSAQPSGWSATTWTLLGGSVVAAGIVAYKAYLYTQKRTMTGRQIIAAIFAGTSTAELETIYAQIVSIIDSGEQLIEETHVEDEASIVTARHDYEEKRYLTTRQIQMVLDTISVMPSKKQRQLMLAVMVTKFDMDMVDKKELGQLLRESLQ